MNTDKRKVFNLFKKEVEKFGQAVKSIESEDRALD